jgi:predicted nucleotidyltransferase
MRKEEIIENIKNVARRSLPFGSNLFLYGSRARGEEHKGSDWDLLILLNKPQLEESDYDNFSFPFTMLGWQIGELISPQMYTRKEWDSMSYLPYYKNVERDKIVLI